MGVGFVLTIMVLTTEEKVFIVEHYFLSYRVGRQNGPSLPPNVREHYEEQFNKTAPSNIILAIVEKFHRKGSVLWKGTTLWCSLNFMWNGIPGPFRLPGSHGPRCLHMGHAERIRFPIRWPIWKCFRITGEDIVIFCVLQQPVFISMSNNLKDRYEQCVRLWRILRYTAYTGGIPNFGGLKTLMKCVSSQKKVLIFLNVSPTNQ